MNYQQLKKEIVNKLATYLIQTYNVEDIDIKIEVPNDFKNGNLSSNVALKYAKMLGKNPRDLATELVDVLTSIENVEKVEMAGPGFLNVYFTKQFYTDMVFNIQYNDEYGQLSVEKPQNINVEFVSANPTGDLHLGHARGAAYGDSVSRLLKKQGHNVTKEYYINDAGAQMQNLGKSIYHFYLLEANMTSEFPDDGYGGQEIKDMAKIIFNEYGNDKIEESIEWFVEYGYARNLKELKRILKAMNVEFDVWSSEREYHISGKVKNSLDTLQKTGNIYEQDGAIWLNTSKYGDDKDRVIEKQDGSHTYFTSDIAYHIDKFERGFDHLIDVWGGDHHGYMKRVECALEALGHNHTQFEILLIQMINILQNNEKVKMSKRAGTSVTINDLLKEVDSEAIRYFFIMRSPDTQVDFDLDLAKSQSSENPVFYVQYAHARINSLINTFNEKEINLVQSISELSEIEKELVFTLAKFEDVINEAAEKRLPHVLSNYLYELATLYHRYYNAEKVFSNNEQQINDKINIVIAVKQVIKNGLDILGIVAKDNM